MTYRNFLLNLTLISLGTLGCGTLTSKSTIYDVKNMIKRSDTRDIEELIEEIIGDKQFVVIRYVMNNCPSCEHSASGFVKLAKKYSEQVKFIEINDSEFPRMGSKHKIRSMPTYILIKDGKVIKKTGSAIPIKQLENTIKEHFHIS